VNPQPFTTLTGVAAPLMLPDIDTDVIIRIERLAGTPRGQLGPHALETLRYRAEGGENPDFILNQAPFRQARILVAGKNFGCGSSRENAVWALADFGIRAIIAPSFGDIFFDNCFQNGLLPIRLAVAEVEALAASITPAACTLVVDLTAQTVADPRGRGIAFDIDPYRKRMLESGLDEIGMTLTRPVDIEAAEARDRTRRPWLYN